MIGLLTALALATPCEVPPIPEGLCATGALFSWHAADPPCDLPVPPRGIASRALRNDPADAKAVRDADGPYPNELHSENFALKWGVDATFSEDDARTALDALEASWALMVETWGYDGPFGTDRYKFNAYIGGTGSGTPSDLGNAGYYWYDDDGYPMLVLSRDILRDPETLEITAPHEFFHAIQDANGRFEYDDVSGWWWEATAVWVTHEVFPETSRWPNFLYWFAIRPELWIGHFEYPTYGTPEEFHQYGAFIFVTHLAERHGGPALIRATFDRSTRTTTPLRVLEELLAEDGASLAESFGAFAVRNATWDYPDEEDFEAWIEIYRGADEEHRPSGTVFGQTDGWTRPPAWLPRTYGANYWHLLEMGDAVRVAFEGDPGPTWRVAVASQQGAVHRVDPIPLVDGTGEAIVTGLDVADDAWLVVSATAGLVDDGTTWSYAFAIEEAEVDDGRGVEACGCRTSPPHAAPGWILSLVAGWTGWVRRRRRTTALPRPGPSRPDPPPTGT